ncbi:hypothetical protein BCR44DRAFT_27021 [Catenaria anguillulae PL171]|uniref:DUF1917-domain-containing protein n=1 Tax=Catenaria anguillulae PL171 TaxID=765915 RepID=A0A1Y2HXM0_9FUNG|nr:hypothetical protein BCR44DRAFT_27021 [Catenaria anguillulae PL171]
MFLSRDSNESVSAFLARFVPTRTTIAQGAWIYIDNPSCASPSAAGAQDLNTQRPNWELAVPAATQILSTLAGQLASTPTLTLARQRQLRQSTTAALKHVATQHHATIGKWILFYPHAQVDQAWTRVATATAAGTLGVAAKVNTTTPAHANGERTYVICVYTHDFNDRADVRRVLVQLFWLGLTPAGLAFHDEEGIATKIVDHKLPSASCTWKPDLYTYLGLDTGNPWGIAPTLYRWQEFLPPKSTAISSKTRRASDVGDDDGHVIATSKRSRSNENEKVVLVEGVDF